MDYVICIPSYMRAQICKNKTLATLIANNINPNKIYIFVASQEEYNDYNIVLEKDTYRKLIIGKKGIIYQRQFIMTQFPTNSHIVCIDDDISNIDLSLSDLFKHKTLDYFFKYAFNECIKRRSFIWGVYPVFNPYFRGPRVEITIGLNFIVGSLYGIINRPKLKAIQNIMTENMSPKEDTERSILYYKYDGISIRFNKVGFKTKYFNNTGGLGGFNTRLKSSKDACEYLKKIYPTYGHIVTRKNGMTEFKMNPLLTQKT